jgi:ribonuclease J
MTGVDPDRIVLCEDGDVVDLVDGRARVTGKVDCRYIYVDGLAVGDVGEASLTERRILGDEGFIAVTVVVDEVTGKVVGGPFVTGKGFSDEPAFADAVPIIEAALHRAAADGVSDPHQLQQVVRRAAGKWVSDTYRRRPMIVPTVLEV